MRIRTNTAATTKEPAKKTEKRSTRGGARPGAGRPAYMPANELKQASAYISLTLEEKTAYEAKAAAAGLTLSFYLRSELGLAV